MNRRNFLKFSGISTVCAVFGINAVAKEPNHGFKPRTIAEQEAIRKKSKIVMMSTPSGKESEMYRLHKKMMVNSTYGFPVNFKHDFGIV